MKKTPKRKRGRPKIPVVKASPKAVNLGMVERMASVGCSEQIIADVFGISWETIRQIKKRSNEFSVAYKKGRANLKYSILRKQTMKALSGEGNATMLIWLGKNILGQRDMPIDVSPDAGDLDEYYKAILPDGKRFVVGPNEDPVDAYHEHKADTSE